MDGDRRSRHGAGAAAPRSWTLRSLKATRHRPVPVSVPPEVSYSRHPAATSAASRGTNGGGAAGAARGRRMWRPRRRLRTLIDV